MFRVCEGLRMPTDTNNVRPWGKTGSEGRAFKAALLM
jgi:hypothetical protein